MFVGGVPARTAAELAGVNRHSATLFYQKIRKIIADELNGDSPFDGGIGLDENYFCNYRKDNLGCSAAGKIPVFGLLKRGCKVYTQVILEASSKTLTPVITHKVQADSVVYADDRKAYDAIDVMRFHNSRINHSELVSGQQNRIDGTENFWKQTKWWLHRHNRIPKEHFSLFLKECEFRFNLDSPAAQLRTLKHWKLKHLI